jgi:hypothetical protein
MGNASNGNLLANHVWRLEELMELLDAKPGKGV